MKPVSFLVCLSVVLLLCACDSKKPAPAPAKAPEVNNEPQNVTTGVLKITGLPGATLTNTEIIVLPSITSETRSLIQKQNQAMRAFLFPPTEAAPNADQVVSEDDAKHFAEELAPVQAEFPERLTFPYKYQGREQKYTTSQGLWDKYNRYIQGLNASNFIRGLEHINQEMQTDYGTLKSIMEGDRKNEANQALSNVNWMSTLSEYMASFQPLIRQYDTMRKNFLMSQANSGDVDPEILWNEFQANNARNLELRIYKDSIDAAYPDTAGKFALNGHGSLVVRSVIEGGSVFLIPDDIGGEHAQISELSEVSINPDTAQ
ncbi:MAG: hypothetical protein AAFX93_05485 [Verrucomicrobiota bacterium]